LLIGSLICTLWRRIIARPPRTGFCRSLLVPSVIAALLACLVTQAAAKPSESRPVDVRVAARGFGGASSADIKAVLQSAAGELSRYCSRNQLPHMDVYHRSDHPQTDLERTALGRIAVGLVAQDNHWAQYAFQFAHEYCHALINYNNTSDELAPHAQHPNLWLEESLCETASLFTLRALSRSWLVRPPYPVWQEYAPWFSVYAEKRLALPEHNLPAGTPFVVWFRANEPALRQDSTRRDRNTIVAAQLLPIFEKEPRGWGALAFFSRSSSPNQSLAQLFIDWRSRCPPDLRRFLRKLAGVFDVQI
jgi:hypothetical protein